MRPVPLNNARVMIESHHRADDPWRRVSSHIPDRLQERHVEGLNERLRFYRYGRARRFAWHRDGCFRRPNGEESLLTFMVYLNGGVEGGETRFENATIRPRPDLVLVFHHYLPHEGAVVTAGQKYVLRSDIMYGPSRIGGSLGSSYRRYTNQLFKHAATGSPL